MWQTDIVYLQTVVNVNTLGSIKQTWSKSESVKCDVQSISKDTVYKEYGYTGETEYRQVFDHTMSTWVKGYQVEYLGEQWQVRNVISGLNKMGLSNHTYVILSKVL